MPPAQSREPRCRCLAKHEVVRNGGRLRHPGMKFQNGFLLLSLAVGSISATQLSDFALHAEVSDDQLLLSWSEGRPAFQLQGKANIGDPWANISAPTQTNSIALPLQDDQKFFRIVQDYTARYQVVFNATWSRETHPD